MEAVLDLPTAQRTHGVVVAVHHVQRHLGQVAAQSRAVNELGDSMKTFASQRLALPQ
ncbi:hypothetical protein [Amycolatopsis sulphurea]|uniref:hypothetical protein n=1 Tax=Amycolatopsis sulphurea TaxID=76022 RepID=UPI001472ACF5|nr:hypothetical protein [Amycolatopsis sulphurea]